MRTITAFAVLVISIGSLSAGVRAFGQSTEVLPETEDSVPAPARDRRYSLGISSLFGMVYGSAEEIVYPTGSTKGEFLSQLLWDMKPLFYCGALLDFSPIDPMEKWSFYSALSFKAGIPAKTGKMEDRDWQSVENSALTNYSVHDNESREAFWLEGAFGVSFPIKSRFLFSLSANVSYMHFSFTGWGGSFQYAAETSAGHFSPIGEAQKGSFSSGKVINYTQDWLIVAPGLSLNARFLSYFSAELFFQISPLIWCADLDQHLLTGDQFRDYTRWGLFLEPKGRLVFIPNQRLSLSLDLAYRYITGSRGEVYVQPSGSGKYIPAGAAGTGLSLLDTGILCKIRL